MATVTTFLEDTDGAIPHISTRNFYILEKQLDFSATNVSSADVVQVFEVLDDQVCLYGSIEVVTAEGGTATVDLGITGGTLTDTILDGANINQAAGTIIVTGDGTNGQIAKTRTAAADTIDLLINNDLDTAVIIVRCVMVDETSYASSSAS